MYMSDIRKPIFRGMPTGKTVGVTPQIECRIQTHFLAYSGCMIQEIQEKLTRTRKILKCILDSRRKLMSAVQPLYKNHPWEERKLIFVHMWSLFRGSVVHLLS